MSMADERFLPHQMPDQQPESDQQERLLIRAHHLDGLADILAEGRTVDDIVNLAEANARMLEAANTLPYISYTTKRGRYRRDVYGDTVEEAERSKGATRGLYTSLMEAPADTSVTIAEYKPDPICNACAIGEHCKDWIKEDSTYMSAFKLTAEVQGRSADMQLLSEEVELLNGRTRQIELLSTSAEVVRSVVADPLFRRLARAGRIARVLSHAARRRQS